ncbi:hypothetical protein Bbelb_143830 [Branchiostoma belcheri]|nr:hypothetical protein Bbelb_143830 [Branchiostoma belcheri]
MAPTRRSERFAKERNAVKSSLPWPEALRPPIEITAAVELSPWGVLRAQWEAAGKSGNRPNKRDNLSEELVRGEKQFAAYQSLVEANCVHGNNVRVQGMNCTFSTGHVKSEMVIGYT